MTPEMRRVFAERNGQDPAAGGPESLSMGDHTSEGALSQATPADAALAAFLEVYEGSIATLCTEQDYHELMLRYLQRCRAGGVVYSEISFDPQAHLTRGVALSTVMDGFASARAEGAERLGVESELIMCFHLDKPVENALDVLRDAAPFADQILGVGLDNNEVEGWAPMFGPVLERARSLGYRTTAHCACDMPGALESIRTCIVDVGLERIDHGINILEDPELVATARELGVCFTVCPTRRVGEDAPRRIPQLRGMLDAGLLVNVNSDDPGLFASGPLDQLLVGVAGTGLFDAADLCRMAANSFTGSWLPPARRDHYLAAVDEYAAAAGAI